jgi:hypothetical protein
MYPSSGWSFQAKWSHVPLTFYARDVDLHSAPHADAMVINCRWQYGTCTKYLSTMAVRPTSSSCMPLIAWASATSYSSLQINLYMALEEKGTFPIGKIELSLSFRTTPNARSEQFTFDIVDMVYPYNAIMGQGSINKFEAAIHGLYLHENPRPSRHNHNIWRSTSSQNIERDFIPGQCNVHCLMTKCKETNSPCTTKSKKVNAQLQSNEGTKTVPLDPATPKQTVLVSEDLLPNEEARLLSCLNHNKDIFAWSALDLIGVSRTVIEHSLGIDSSMCPRKQKLRKMSDEKIEAAKAKVHRLLKKNSLNQLLTPPGSPMSSWCKRKMGNEECALTSPTSTKPAQRTIFLCHESTKSLILQPAVKSCLF